MSDGAGEGGAHAATQTHLQVFWEALGGKEKSLSIQEVLSRCSESSRPGMRPALLMVISTLMHREQVLICGGSAPALAPSAA